MGKQTDYLSEAEWDGVKAELDKHYRIVHRIDDDAGTAHDLVWVKTIIHQLAARDHCGVVIIDPWNELEHLPEKGESLTSYVNFALTKMRQWAEKYDVHICIVAHPRKLQAGEKPSGYTFLTQRLGPTRRTWAGPLALRRELRKRRSL